MSYLFFFFFESFREKERARKRARLCCLSCRCIHTRTCVYVFFPLLGRKKHGPIPLLTSLMFHVLTCWLIFKLSWKSQQPLVGKASWENFKCIYNFYLPSSPAIKCRPLQVGLTIFQASKLLLPGMTEILTKAAMFATPMWPSLRNTAFAEGGKMFHIRARVDAPWVGAELSVVQDHHIYQSLTAFANNMWLPLLYCLSS